MSGSRPLGRDPAGASGSPEAAGLHPLVPILLRLYPRGWRTRYESEFLALLADGALTPSTFPDIVLAALDARLSGEYPITEGDGRKARFRMPARTVPLAIVAGGAFITASIAFAFALDDGDWEFPGALLLLGFPIGFVVLAGGIIGLALGDRTADPVLRGMGVLAALLGAAVAAAMLGMAFLGDGWWYAWSGLYIAFTFASGGFGLRLAMLDRSRLIPGAILVGGIAVGLLGVGSFAGIALPDGLELILTLPLVGWIALGIAELMRDRMVPAG